MGGQKQSILGNEYWTNMGEAGMKLVLQGKGRRTRAGEEGLCGDERVTYRRRKGLANESYWSLGKEVSLYSDKKWFLSKIKLLFQENYIVQICRVN